MQPEDFPRGHSSLYYSHLNTHNCGVLMGFDTLVLIWSHQNKNVNIPKTLIKVLKLIYLKIYFVRKRISYVGGWESKTVDRIGKGISKEVNFMEYWWHALGKYSPTMWRGWTTIVEKDTEDSYLTLESQKSGVNGSTTQPEGEKWWLGSEQGREEKERKKQTSSPHWMHCNHLTDRINEKMTMNSAHAAYT